MRRVYFSGTMIYRGNYCAWFHGWRRENGGIVGAVVEFGNGEMYVEEKIECLTFED